MKRWNANSLSLIRASPCGEGDWWRWWYLNNIDIVEDMDMHLKSCLICPTKAAWCLEWFPESLHASSMLLVVVWRTLSDTSYVAVGDVEYAKGWCMHLQYTVCQNLQRYCVRSTAWIVMVATAACWLEGTTVMQRFLQQSVFKQDVSSRLNVGLLWGSATKQ